MGHRFTVPVPATQLRELEVTTYLTQDAVMRAVDLWARSGGSVVRVAETGYLEVDDMVMSRATFLAMPAMSRNPWASRFFDVFTGNNGHGSSADLTSTSTAGGGSLEAQTISLAQFLAIFSVLSPNAPQMSKVAAAFQIYDFDGDGWLSYRDLDRCAKTILGTDALGQREFDVICSQAMFEIVGEQNTGVKISQREFSAIMTRAVTFDRMFRHEL